MRKIAIAFHIRTENGNDVVFRVFIYCAHKTSLGNKDFFYHAYSLHLTLPAMYPPPFRNYGDL